MLLPSNSNAAMNTILVTNVMKKQLVMHQAGGRNMNGIRWQSIAGFVRMKCQLNNI
jgi:hypothetical protein